MTNIALKMRRMSEVIINLIDTSKNAISSLHVDKILTQTTKILPSLIGADAVMIRLVDQQNPRLLSLEIADGLSGSIANKIKYLQLGVGIEGNAAKSRSHINVRDISIADSKGFANELTKFGLRSVLAVPIIFDSDLYGTITVCSKAKSRYAKKDIFVLMSFSTIVAIALRNAFLYRNLKNSYLNTINSLVMIMESRDHYMRGHSERVTYIAVEIARNMNLPESDLQILRTAGKLHDIGKITISDRILNKKEKLSPSEWAEIKLHPVRGVEMVMPLKFLEPGIPLIRNHHERYDGKGYPDGLGRDAIPMLPKILAVADSYDAMTSKRPYRKPLSIDQATDEIRANSGTQFDPAVVKTFVRIIGNIH